MEKEKIGVESTDRTREPDVEDIIKIVFVKNKEIVKLIYDNSRKENLEDDFKQGIFSNFKLKIVESIAEEMKIENPGSKEAWNKVIEKYPLEKLRELIDEVAEEELKNWTYRNHETSD